MTRRMLNTNNPAWSTGNVVKGYDGGILLMQHPRNKRRSFAVQYGKQLDEHLTYGETCVFLGQAIMHHLSCEGLVDNERD